MTEEQVEAYRQRHLAGLVNTQGEYLLRSLPPMVSEIRWTEATTFYENRAGKNEALTAARQMAADGFVHQRGRDRYCLCFTGEYGTGKTFLGTATYKQLVKRYLIETFRPQVYDRDPDMPEGVTYTRSHASRTKDKKGRPEWIKFYAFIRSVQSAYHKTSEVTVEQVLTRYQTAPVLMLDDVGDLDVTVESEDRRRLLYEVLDHRNDYGLPTVLTTNLSLKDFEAQFGGRTVQRVIEMAALVEMGGDNLRLVS